MTPPWATLPGARVITADVAGTTLLTITAVPAAIVGGAALWPAFIVAFGLFAAGGAIFVAAYAAAVERSRRDEMGIGGLFFLAGKGTAPVAVKWWLLGALGAQTVVAFTTAAIRPFSTLAFGMLSPLYGVALCGLWGARHGRFGSRLPDRERRTRPAKVEATAERGKNARHG